MKYRNFGDTGLVVSEVGFGCWAIGGAAQVGSIPIGWGPTNDAVSHQALHAALDAGINFFDTADFYGLGHSEVLLGEVLGNRSDIIIATKGGQKVGSQNEIEHNNTKRWLIEACEQSLKRLRREAIDYYQLHVANLESLKQGECIDAMQTLQAQGKIRFWGHSLFTWKPAPEADFLMDQRLGHGFQLALNAINQIAVPTMRQAFASGYGIIARMPLQFGLLTGSMRPGSSFVPGDHRSMRINDNIIQATMDVLRTEMVPMAKQYNTNLAGLALAFVLGFPEVATVIVGMRHPQQVASNTKSLPNLSDSDHQYLQSLMAYKWQPVLQLITGI
ncbi:MAG: aldo/keto reductase [Bacteroidetes bacterium]|nr:MAG: aldo/keto reductase [Bacteroidota bacterium]